MKQGAVATPTSKFFSSIRLYSQASEELDTASYRRFMRRGGLSLRLESLCSRYGIEVPAIKTLTEEQAKKYAEALAYRLYNQPRKSKCRRVCAALDSEWPELMAEARKNRTISKAPATVPELWDFVPKHELWVERKMCIRELGDGSYVNEACGLGLSGRWYTGKATEEFIAAQVVDFIELAVWPDGDWTYPDELCDSTRMGDIAYGLCPEHLFDKSGRTYALVYIWASVFNAVGITLPAAKP